MPFQIGDILAVSWDKRPIRVIQTDAAETFYDCMMDEVGWLMARSRTAIYYRMSTPLLESTASFVEAMPLSSKEKAKFRPDLPMRLFRHRDADWSDALPRLFALVDDYRLPANEIAIIPFGAKGGSSKPVKICNGSGESLSLWSIVEAAHSAQQAKSPDVHGIGLYRSGIVGGVPSYYLWGSIDRAGHAA